MKGLDSNDVCPPAHAGYLVKRVGAREYLRWNRLGFAWVGRDDNPTVCTLFDTAELKCLDWAAAGVLCHVVSAAGAQMELPL